MIKPILFTKIIHCDKCKVKIEVPRNSVRRWCIPCSKIVAKNRSKNYNRSLYEGIKGGLNIIHKEGIAHYKEKVSDHQFTQALNRYLERAEKKDPPYVKIYTKAQIKKYIKDHKL